MIIFQTKEEEQNADPKLIEGKSAYRYGEVTVYADRDDLVKTAKEFRSALQEVIENNLAERKGKGDTFAILYLANLGQAINEFADNPNTNDYELLKLTLEMNSIISPDGGIFDKLSDEASNAVRDMLPKSYSLTQSSHLMPNDALTNKLQEDVINAGAFDLRVSKAKGKRNEITAYTMIDYVPDDNVTPTLQKLSEYERQVSDAIFSLYDEAMRRKVTPIITTDMIYRAMPGGGEKASAQQKGAITKAIDKFRRLHISIDATDELQKRGKIGKSDTAVFDDFYLTVLRGRYTTANGGKVTDGYVIHSEPIVYKYCKLTGQILTVDPVLLDIKEVKNDIATTVSVSMNAERQSIIGYMLRRIKNMQYDYEETRKRYNAYNKKAAKDKTLKPKALEAFRTQQPVILFSTLFTAVDIKTEDRKQIMLYRKFCYDVLEYWKAKGFISDYHERKTGRSITGIEICL